MKEEGRRKKEEGRRNFLFSLTNNKNSLILNLSLLLPSSSFVFFKTALEIQSHLA